MERQLAMILSAVCNSFTRSVNTGILYIFISYTNIDLYVVHCQVVNSPLAEQNLRDLNIPCAAVSEKANTS